MKYLGDRFEFKDDEKNGCLVGSDGCHYDNKKEAIYFAEIGLCGCGNPEDVHKFLLDCMKATDGNIIDYKKVSKLISDNPDTVTQFVLHFLDSISFTEHGSSVYGSWLTDLGKQAIEIGSINE